MALIVQNSFERTQDETKNFGQDHLVTSTKQNVKIMMFKIIRHLFLNLKPVNKTVGDTSSPSPRVDIGTLLTCSHIPVKR